MKNRKRKLADKRQQTIYPIISSSVYLLFSIVFAIVCSLISDCYEASGILFLVLDLLFLTNLVYFAITWKKRTKYDFYLTLILLLSTISTRIQQGGISFYFLPRSSFRINWEMHYTFPGLRKLEQYRYSQPDRNPSLVQSRYLFDTTFLVSVLSLIASVIYFLHSKKQMNQENN